MGLSQLAIAGFIMRWLKDKSLILIKFKDELYEDKLESDKSRIEHAAREKNNRLRCKNKIKIMGI